LAWESIIGEKETLDLSPFQVRQAETQRNTADSAVTGRIPEAYQWLLVPVQNTPQSDVEWQSFRLSGSDALAARASKKLRNDELLLTAFAPSRLKMELDRVLWGSSNHVSIKQLVEYFTRYLYLPRLKDPEVLLGAIRDGLSLVTWHKDSFAYADSYDEAAGRYAGLRGGQQVSIVDADAPGLLVKPDVARKQLDKEKTEPAATEKSEEAGDHENPPELPPPVPLKPKRYHGTVELDPERVGRDAGQIADEVISHLAGLVGANLTVTLEIEAEIPNGAPDNVVRTVTENARTLKFKNQGFEKE
jgi:hypothetical protein